MAARDHFDCRETTTTVKTSNVNVNAEKGHDSLRGEWEALCEKDLGKLKPNLINYFVEECEPTKLSSPWAVVVV